MSAPAAPAAVSRPSVGLAALALAGGAASLLLLLLLSGITHETGGGLLTAAMVLVLCAGAVAVLMRPRWVFLAFLVTCMVVPFVLEQISLPLGFMKLYVQDVVFGYNLFLIAVRWTLGKRTYKPLPFNKYLLVHLALGVFALLVGFGVSHNQFDDVFGDFRRSYFYFMNYFIAILLVDSLRDARHLRMALIIGACGAILKGLFEFGAGQFVYRRIGDAAHVLTHFEITFLMFVIYYGIAQILFRKERKRLMWSIPAALGVIVVAIGNFRACWLALLTGLMFLFFFLPGRQRRTLVLVGALGATFLGLTIATMWDVQVVEGHSTIGEEIMAKADVKNTTSDINVIWRFESYANALQQWQRSPIIGTGLGEVLEFSASTSTGGATLEEGHRVHNSFIWLLMSLGVLGFSVFLYIQSRYVLAVVRYIRTTTWVEGRITVLACAAFYISILTAACFEIFLESAMPITVLSSSMALAMMMIYYTPAIGAANQGSPAAPGVLPASQS